MRVHRHRQEDHRQAIAEMGSGLLQVAVKLAAMAARIVRKIHYPILGPWIAEHRPLARIEHHLPAEDVHPGDHRTNGWLGNQPAGAARPGRS